MRRIAKATLAGAMVVTMSGPGSTAEAQPAATEVIAIENEGWRLVADWTRLDTGDPVPAVLLLHRAAGNRGEYEALSQELVRRGIASMALDLRGHGDSANLGRFEPPYADNLHINDGAHRDVIVALAWLADQGGVDPARLAVVGASYSGEAVGLALRQGGGRIKAAVMLSPGNFSDESIAYITGTGARWLFVRTEEEGPAALPHIDALFAALAADAPDDAERWVLEGAGHATHIFDDRPELAGRLAGWISTALSTASASR